MKSGGGTDEVLTGAILRAEDSGYAGSGGGVRELGRSEARARRLGRSSAHFSKSDAAEHRQVGSGGGGLDDAPLHRYSWRATIGGAAGGWGRSPGVSRAAGAGARVAEAPRVVRLCARRVEAWWPRAAAHHAVRLPEAAARGAARGKSAAGSAGARHSARETGRVARAAEVRTRRTEVRPIPRSAARQLRTRRACIRDE